MAVIGGTQCRMTVNWWVAGELTPEPADAVGDFLRTEAGSCYLIDEWRPAREGSKSLGAFICTRLGKDAVQFGDPGVHEWIWAARRPAGR